MCLDDLYHTHIEPIDYCADCLTSQSDWKLCYALEYFIILRNQCHLMIVIAIQYLVELGSLFTRPAFGNYPDVDESCKVCISWERRYIERLQRWQQLFRQHLKRQRVCFFSFKIKSNIRLASFCIFQYSMEHGYFDLLASPLIIENK
jgi:hypothetical protein